jgi:lycopene cyclase domain-containing protein
MSYSVLVLIGILACAVWDLVIVRTRMLCRKAFWTAYAILFGFQLLVNGLLTGLPIVRYTDHSTVGIRFAYAPIEDIGFGFVLIVFTLSSWVACGRHRAADVRGRYRARNARK